MSRVVTVYERGSLCVATFDVICMTAIGGPITSEFLREANAAGAALAKQAGRRIGAIDVIGVRAPMPSAELRAEAAALTRATEGRVAAGVYLVAGEGFAASAKRSVLTGMSLLARGSPRRAFAKPGPAIDWLATQLGARPTDLEPAVEWCERVIREQA